MFSFIYFTKKKKKKSAYNIDNSKPQNRGTPKTAISGPGSHKTQTRH